MKGNSKRTSGNSLNPLGAQNKDLGTASQTLQNEVKFRLRRRLVQLGLRSDDGDGNGNATKAIDLISKTTILHVHHDFLHISLPSLHDYDDVQRKYTSDDEISSLFLNLDMVLRIQL